MTKHVHVQLGLPFIPQRVVPAADTRVVMAMYLLASPALRDFVMPLGVNAYHVGLTVERYLEQKVLEVGLLGYGSIVAPIHDRDKAILVHPQANDWRLEPLPCPSLATGAAAFVAQLPAGAYADGVITFRLPHELRIADVEAQFRSLLAARNLNIFLSSATGRERLAKSRMPAGTRLFTDYDQDGQPRRSLASKIYLIRPQRELAVLIQALVLAINACSGQSKM